MSAAAVDESMRGGKTPFLLRAALFLPLAALMVVFFRTDLTAWDMVGHMRAAAAYRDHLWPSLLGWNSTQGFGGYPQGYFYPPLFAWLVGGLGKVVPLAWAFRALVGASLLLLPISVLAFLRPLGCDGRAAMGAVFCLLTGLLLETEKSFGGFFSATLRGGLVTAEWTLPLVFFYLAALKRLVMGWRGVVEASAWLGLLILGHGFNALAAVLLSTIYVPVFAGDQPVRRVALRYGAHAAMTLGLAAAFVIPAAAYHEWTSGRPVTGYSILGALRTGLWFYVPAATLFLWSCKESLVRRDRVARALAYPVVGVALLYVLAKWLRASGLVGGLPLHSYRFVLFAIMFGCMAAGRVVARLRPPVMVWATSVVFFVGTVLCVRRDLGVRERALRIPDLGMVSSRGLVDESTSNGLTRIGSPHLLSSALEEQGLDVLNGVFLESSAVSPYVYGLLRERDPHAFLGTVELIAPHPRLAPWHASLLGVEWFFAQRSPTQEVGTALQATTDVPISLSTDVEQQRQTWSLERTDHPLAELFSAEPAWPGRSPWGTLVRNFWEGKSSRERIPVRASQLSAPFEAPEPRDRVRIQKQGPDEYVLDIDSDRPRWVYVKIPYFPTWHAYQDGHELPLYEASVHLMAVYGRGEVRLRSSPGKLEVLAEALSASMWSLLLLGLVAHTLVRIGRAASRRVEVVEQPPLAPAGRFLAPSGGES
jgi:hypothetical protein